MREDSGCGGLKGVLLRIFSGRKACYAQIKLDEIAINATITPTITKKE